MEKIKNFDIIVYHSGCSDGTGSLWSANHYKPIETKIPCEAGKNPDSDVDAKDKNIIFVDLFPTLEYILETSKIAKNIVILDHHKSALDLYEKNKVVLDDIKNVKIILDMNRSGCMMTWDYFFEREKRPFFIDYIGDRDLWTWKLYKSKEINAALFHLKYLDTYNLSKLTRLLGGAEFKIKKLEKEGELILRIQNQDIYNAVRDADESKFTYEDKVYRVWLVGNFNLSLRSEVGNKLVTKNFEDGTKPDFAAIYKYDFEENVWWISVRGNEHSPDLSKICTSLGGGGHACSASFVIKDPKGLQTHFTKII